MNSRKIATIVGVLILLAYSVLASSVTDLKWVVTFFEVIIGLAVIGIAVLMFPFFKSHGLRFGYISLKSVEGLIMIIAGFFFLGGSVFGLRDPMYSVHTYIFIVSAFIFYVLLYKTRIVPRFISVWGMIAVVLLLVSQLWELSGSIPMVVSVIGLAPMVLNEFYLAIHLMVKGFKANP